MGVSFHPKDGRQRWNEDYVAIIQSADNGFAIHKSVSSVDIGTTKISAILLTGGDG